MEENQREIRSRFEDVFRIQKESETRLMRLADMIIVTRIGRDAEDQLGREVETGLTPEQREEVRNLRDEIRMAVEAIRQAFLGRFKPKFASLFLIAERSAYHSVSLSAVYQCAQLARDAVGLDPDELDDVQRAAKMVDFKFKHSSPNSSPPPPPSSTEQAEPADLVAVAS
ncbi:MAG: hypothetical protein PHC70_01085 [Patescibacteria group bacterium]|nr:hypothetical protein [Patescibacteria group bacterium]